MGLFFSVLTTVYNRERFLEEAVRRVLAQTFQDWELILVDDVSTDNSWALAQRLADLDPRIRISRNETNLGDYPNRNRAVELSSGRYLKYLDADDVMHPDCLATYAANFDAEDPPWGFAINAELEGDATISGPLVKVLTSRDAYRRQYVERRRTFTAAPASTLYVASSFKACGGFAPDRMTGDFELAHRLAALKPVLVVSTGAEPLVYWREHEDQQMADHGLYKLRYVDIARTYTARARHFFTPDERHALQDLLIEREARAFVSMLRGWRLNDAVNLFRARKGRRWRIWQRTMSLAVRRPGGH